MSSRIGRMLSVQSLAAALIADAPIMVRGVERLSKSWPGFVDTYRKLGGMVE